MGTSASSDGTFGRIVICIRRSSTAVAKVTVTGSRGGGWVMVVTMGGGGCGEVKGRWIGVRCQALVTCGGDGGVCERWWGRR